MLTFTHFDGESGRELVRFKSLADAQSCSGSGEQSDNVAALMPHVEWLGDRADLQDNLSQYGSWTDEELNAKSDDEIRTLSLWLAACDVSEEPEAYADNLDFYTKGLRDAMAQDGWAGKTDCNYCDISAALRAGFVLSAAHLLLGATECPAVEAYLDREGGIPERRDGWPLDWDKWVEWFHENSVECSKCGAFCFNDEFCPNTFGDTCDNCGAELPTEDDEGDDTAGATEPGRTN